MWYTRRLGRVVVLFSVEWLTCGGLTWLMLALRWWAV